MSPQKNIMTETVKNAFNLVDENGFVHFGNFYDTDQQIILDLLNKYLFEYRIVSVPDEVYCLNGFQCWIRICSYTAFYKFYNEYLTLNIRDISADDLQLFHNGSVMHLTQ